MLPRPAQFLEAGMDFQVEARDAMTRRDKVVFAALVVLYIATVLYYAIWWFQPQRLPMNWPELGNLGLALDTILFICLSFVVWRGVVLNLFVSWAISAMKIPVHISPPPGLRVAVVTCFVPGTEPYDVLERTLTAMTHVRYPHDTWVLDEGDDLVVRAMCYRLGVKHFTRKGIPEYNQPSGKFRTRIKGGNHNAFVDKHGHEYDVVAQMDVDFVPRPDYLEKTLGYFRDPKVAYVGSPQIHGNQSESWVAKGAAEQVYMFYGPLQKGLYGLGMQLLIGGNHVYRIEAWRDIDGYSDSVTEDHITGMKVYAKGWKSVFVPEVLCVGEVPADMITYLGQQMRWAFGLTHILLRYTPGLIRKLTWTQRIGYVNLQLFYFFGLASLIAITLVTLYLALGITAISTELGDWLLHAVPPFLISLAMFRWLQKYNIDPQTEKGWGLRGIILFFAAWPVYVLGLFYAFIGHKLSYNITRKGSPGQAMANRPSLRILAPYFISAAISLVGLVIYPLVGFSFPPMVFWAAFNLGTMILVVLALRQSTVPAPAPLRLRTLRRTFPTAMATATSAIVVLASVNLPALFNFTPYTYLHASTKYVKFLKPVEAQFLEPNSPKVAIGAVVYTGDELEKVAKISHKFINWQPEQLQQAVYAIRYGAMNDKVTMITWQPTFLTFPDTNPDRPERSILQQIINGEFDGYIAEAASIFRDTKQPILLRFAHEMDIDDDGIHPWSEQPPELYIAAFRHVHDIFKEKQADNVLWLWSPSGQWEPGRFISLDWYPGDSYVDVIGLSIFVNWRWEEWNEERKAVHAYRSALEMIGWTYDQISHLNKPVVLAEVGVDLYPDRKDERKYWIKAMLDLVRQERYANIVGVVFFNQRLPFEWPGDFRLTKEEMSVVTTTVRSDDAFDMPSRQAEKKMVSRQP